jgi:RHS repeat-associated protein
MHNQCFSLLRRTIRLIKIPLNLIIILSFIVSAATPVSSVVAISSSPSLKKNITSNQIEENDNNYNFNLVENTSAPLWSTQAISLLSSSPELYIGLETLPEVNLYKESCLSDSCSRWVYGNTFGTTVDAAVGIIFKADATGEIGKRMHCNNAGCNGSASMFANTSDDFTDFPNNSTYCVANYAFGLDKNAICNQMAPSAIPLLLGVDGFPSNPMTNLAGGFAVGWHKSVEATLRIYDIHFIYYGVPPSGALTRSLLSSNKPKNRSGDSRECAVSGCANAQATAGDPIDTRTGNFDYSLVDLTLQTIAGPLSFQRSYASLGIDTSQYPTDLGPGWTHNQDTRLIFEAGTVWFKGHTLNQYKFKDNGNYDYTPYAGVLASLNYDAGTSTYSLKASDQSTYTFTSSGQLQNWRNELEYGFDYSYSNDKLYRVTEVLSGRYLQFNYHNGRLTSVNDSSSPVRTVSFAYDGNGDLTSFTDTRGKNWTYEYDGTSHHLKTLKDPSILAKTILSIHYDAQGRADEQFNGKNERIVKIIYNADGTSTLLDAMGRTATDVYDGRNTNSARIDSAGYMVQKSYDANFRPSLVKDQDNRTLLYQWSVDGANLTYIKDADGNETHLQYNDSNHLTQVTDPRNQVMTYAYTGSLLTSVTRQASSGNITTIYSYTTSSDAPQPVGLLKTITDALNHTTTFTYDAMGQLIVVKDADNKETHFAYDDQGRVTDITDPLGRLTHTTYDPAGNVTKVIQNFDAARPQNDQNQYNLTTEFTYDDLGRLTQTRNTLGYSTGYAYDDAGRMYQFTDAYGKTTTSAYNAAGQVISIIDPLGHSAGYEYDSAGRVWKVKDAQNRVVLTFTYNPDGTIHTETRPTDAGDYIVTYNAYDALKRPIIICDNVNHFSTVEYDAYGNPLTRTDALGIVTKYEYNDFGLLEAVTQNYKANPGSEDDPNATNVRTEYTYDVIGNLTKIKDANGHETSYTYDVLNRLWKVTNPLGKVTEYGYDALGNRTSLIDANNQTTFFNYDLANRLDIIDYPSGMADVDFGYDPLGRLIGVDDGLGHTTWVYDNLNRITSIIDPFNKTVGYGYDDDGKRTSITYPSPVSKTITYQYNTLDQLTGVLDGTTLLADYTYDIAGRLIETALGNGVTSTIGYDPSGQLTSLTYATGGQMPQEDGLQQVAYSYQYDATGNRDHVEETQFFSTHFTYLPVILKADTSVQMQITGDALEDAGSISGMSPLDGYPPPASDSLLQPETQEDTPSSPDNAYPAPEVTSAGDGTSFFQGAWDFLVNLFTVDTPTVSAHSDLQSAYPAPPAGGGSAPASNQTITYGYDALHRLISADYTGGLSYSYTYDKVGNRSSQIVGGVNTAYTYDAADRLTNAGGIAFTWDDNGNLLNDGIYSYNYDFANRLTGVNNQESSFTFGYDGLDNRYQQTVNGQTSTNTLDLAGDLSQVLLESAPQELGTSYYYGLRRISQQKDGVTDYFLTDALGSVRQLTDASGDVTFRQSFDPFGNLISQSGQGGSNYGYAGEWTDASGLQNLRARYYSPSQGRFLTKDPFSGFLSQPSTLNAYAYATNNPVLMNDPSGKIAPLLVAAGLGGLIGAGIDIGTQLYNMQPTSLGQALRCLNWGEVGVSFGAGMIAGLTGFTVFGGMTALMGTGFFANVAAGAISGVVAGQYGRLTGLVLSGQVSQASGTLLRPQDMILDAVLGGLGGAVGYGIQRGLSGIADDILQGVTETANKRLGANPGLAQNVLRPREYAAGQANPSIARMQYGNAIERMVRNRVENSILQYFFEHVGGPNNPDFIGKSIFDGLQFDITTPGSVASHLARPYGQGLILLLYNRPGNFMVFP